MADHLHPDCPIALHYRAVWREWATDPENRDLWARVNAALDGLEAQPGPDGTCPCRPAQPVTRTAPEEQP